MTDVHILAIDLAKRSFQICATSPGGAVLFNRTVSRAKLEAHLCEQDPMIGHQITIPLTRLDIADMIGVTPVHLSRTLRDLRFGKVVDWQRHTITILNMPALQKMAAMPERILTRDQEWLPPGNGS